MITTPRSARRGAVLVLAAKSLLVCATLRSAGAGEPSIQPSRQGGAGGAESAAGVSSALLADLAPKIVDIRHHRILQAVELRDVPPGAKRVSLWAAVPGDGPWQQVLERKVVEAPAGWQLVRQPGSRGDMVFVDVPAPANATGPIRIVVESLVRRESPAVDLAAPSTDASINTPLQKELFTDALRTDATFMSADDTIRAMARKACAGEPDPRKKVVRLLEVVADAADHYSKDASKPHCGRGSAEDCMANGGGCCTDLHSLFIAMARAEGIPARLQMGYRLKPENDGKRADPGYRCWVEFWLDGSGWVPTDIVVADGTDSASRTVRWGQLDARRIWLWEGRGFDLVPQQSGPPIQTMFCGWAEIDGTPVDALPADDGRPSKLSRTVLARDVTDEYVGGVGR